MPKKLFLLDGMALVYRAHFALIRSPIFTSTGINASALYGFVNTLLDILARRSYVMGGESQQLLGVPIPQFGARGNEQAHGTGDEWRRE